MKSKTIWILLAIAAVVALVYYFYFSTPADAAPVDSGAGGGGFVGGGTGFDLYVPPVIVTHPPVYLASAFHKPTAIAQAPKLGSTVGLANTYNYRRRPH